MDLQWGLPRPTIQLADNGSNGDSINNRSRSELPLAPSTYLHELRRCASLDSSSSSFSHFSIARQPGIVDQQPFVLALLGHKNGLVLAEPEVGWAAVGMTEGDGDDEFRELIVKEEIGLFGSICSQKQHSPSDFSLPLSLTSNSICNLKISTCY